MILDWAAAAALAIWVYLLFGRGGFWRMRDFPVERALPSPAPSVTAVAPARNEAEVIARAVGSLCGQKYSGAFRVIVVDDDSSDGTAEVARRAAGDNLSIMEAPPLQAGWTGKLWAVAQGVEAAGQTDYLLLTDADIVHPPDHIAALVAQATAGGYDLVSLMVMLRRQTWAERALAPAFVFFFFLLYPPAWTRSARHRTAGAAGGCLLIRRETLERMGGIAAIRSQLIDDCALARAVKQDGGRLWLGLSRGAESIREYGAFGEMGRMISRTAFTQLRHSWLLLAATAAGLTLTFLIPPAAALAGHWLGMAAWFLMCIAYAPVLGLYRRSALWALLLPLVATFYLGATLHSAVAYQRGAGGLWKGRAQDPRES